MGCSLAGRRDVEGDAGETGQYAGTWVPGLTWARFWPPQEAAEERPGERQALLNSLITVPPLRTQPRPTTLHRDRPRPSPGLWLGPAPPHLGPGHSGSPPSGPLPLIPRDPAPGVYPRPASGPRPLPSGP